VRYLYLVIIAVLTASSSYAAAADVAILDSAYTREFFRRHYAGCFAPGFYLPDGQEYQRYFRGWEFVLQEMGHPYEIIGDGQITDAGLSRFSLLVLSNTASLSVEQTRAIHDWVHRGGRLLATFGSGYKGITSDRHEIDGLKAQKGGTFGLHELWHDPVTKVFSSTAFGGAVDIQISRFEGPTAGLEALLAGMNGVLPYGALANILVHRPPQAKDVLAWIRLAASDTVTRYPAIIDNDAAHGRAVYFAFAPEYIVSKEFALPAFPACDDGQSWLGRSQFLRVLMRNTMTSLLTE
jgi:hypothetical protein